MIVAKPGTGVDLNALQEPLRERLASIAFSPLWGRLFGALLEVLAGRQAAGDFWQELRDLGAEPEAEPYRRYFRGLWKTRQQEWGIVPEE